MQLVDRRHAARRGRRRAATLGRQVKAIMDAGELVSDDIIIEMIAERIAAAGLPPRASSSTAFRARCRRPRRSTRCWREQGRKLDHVIEMEVDEAALVDRHRRPLHLRATAAPAITTATSRPKVEGVCDVCGGTRFRAPRRRPGRGGGDAARRPIAARPRRSCPITGRRGILRRGRRHGRDRRGDAADRAVILDGAGQGAARGMAVSRRQVDAACNDSV